MYGAIVALAEMVYKSGGNPTLVRLHVDIFNLLAEAIQKDKYASSFWVDSMTDGTKLITPYGELRFLHGERLSIGSLYVE